MVRSAFAILSAALLTSVGLADTPRPAKPNIVLILTDDLGWQDVKCYDIDEPSPMETPNIDRLATQGVMFWQAYSPTPVCSSSRASILSGQHAARTGVTSVGGGNPPLFRNVRKPHTSPWNSAYMPDSVISLAHALKGEGYVTGHSGKWHFSPGPIEIGFDSTTRSRGVQMAMPNRLTGFATRDPDDPFRLDENGFPYDVPQHAAMAFMAAHKDEPFFLHYCTYLVHAPIHSRSQALLDKYVKKLGVELKPEHKDKWVAEEGQTNPFYCAMVEQLDYYMGQIFSYLETTDDPRWPGHKLSENTYVIFTSDNGGAEGRPTKQRFTENAPLDHGKISTKEGGTRVPLIIVGPGIPAGVQTDVMANGLDFYPTILSLIGAEKPEGAIFDGCDLKPLLTQDPTDPTLVRDAEGQVRDTMVWHFPQMQCTTSIRVGDYKLRRATSPDDQTLELYQLYRTDETGKQVRVDIEEAHNLAAAMPEKAKALEAMRAAMVAEFGGRYAHFNPDAPGKLAGKAQAPTVLSHKQTGNQLEITYQYNGSDVVYADLYYSLTGGAGRHESWRRLAMTLNGKDKAVAELPDGTTHYLINLVDANNFLVVYPQTDATTLRKDGLALSDAAIFAGFPAPVKGEPINFRERFDQLSTPEDGVLVLHSQDFEDEKTSFTGKREQGAGPSNSEAASGQRSMELAEIAGLPQPWMPIIPLHISVPDSRGSGSLRVAFDVKLAEEASQLNLGIRDGRTTAYDLVMDGSAIRANNRLVGGMPPGAWYHVEVVVPFGDSVDRSMQVTVSTADGATVSNTVAARSMNFRRPTWVGFTSFGEEGSKSSIDNVVIRVE
jgi:arylsulfatase A-like enzyme